MPSVLPPFFISDVLCDLNRHTVVSHALATIRNTSSPPSLFRLALRQIGHVLMTYATASLPSVEISVQTPLTQSPAWVRDPEVPLLIVPILRAGLAWADLALEWLPEAQVFHLGMARNEESLEPFTYYNKLLNHPVALEKAHAFVLDPMLATGGSAIESIKVLKAKGIPEHQITFVCLLASPEGIRALHDALPQVRIITAGIDSYLNEQGYIVPGLGDAGDRTFGTL
ncbi:MAG: uracil phosphoribosyltransferase [Vampirovibrio sp.]